ncbi:hypothetical protein CEK64_04960 [Xanthomonas sontii]|nr:hypothetical protein CEK64_04960 [Xanthomonas sontii]
MELPVDLYVGIRIRFVHLDVDARGYNMSRSSVLRDAMQLINPVVRVPVGLALHITYEICELVVVPAFNSEGR